LVVARTTNPRTRPALLQAARDLFYARGIGATGVEDVAAASGLTKPTLYRHFHSKEALVAAYLDDRHEQMNGELRTWTASSPPRQRPGAVVDWLCWWLSSPSFNGCAFVRAHAELLGDREVRDRARGRKAALTGAIEDACRAADVAKPAVLARQLAVVIEGATTMAFVSGDAGAAIAAARELAQLALCAAGLEPPDE
jgi:AcrR family transcriptional regulator